MNLDTIWNMKNSMDSLHYMFFEAMTFNVAWASSIPHIFRAIYYTFLEGASLNDGLDDWVFNCGPCVLIITIRVIMAYGFINQVGQKKNTLFGECPYTAWCIYLGMTLTIYFGLVYWFYTRDNSTLQPVFFVLL
jgi:hypothetical protein